MDNSTIQTIIQGLGLLSIIGLGWQIRSSNKWNKLSYSINNRLDQYKVDEIVTQLHGRIDMSSEGLSDVEYEKCIKDDFVLDKIRTILNSYEEICCLYNMGAIDKNFAYSAYSKSVLYFYEKFKKIIDFYRIKDDDQLEYIEMERCNDIFIVKEDKEKKSIDKAQKKLALKKKF